MICPLCGSDDSRVIDSRHISDGSTRRRRVCKGCNIRFSTYELSAEEYDKLKHIEELAISLKEVIDNDWQTV